MYRFPVDKFKNKVSNVNKQLVTIKDITREYVLYVTSETRSPSKGTATDAVKIQLQLQFPRQVLLDIVSARRGKGRGRGRRRRGR